MTSRHRKNSIAENFVTHRRIMRESPAWQALPDNARRVLDRIELEHMRHGGAENGYLPCTYNDFAANRIRRASVALAIRQCVELGFLEVMVKGYRAGAGFKVPSKYRLTYIMGLTRSDYGRPTDEWAAIKTPADAEAALERARIDKNHDKQPRSVRPPAPGSIERGRATAPNPGDALARLGGRHA